MARGRGRWAFMTAKFHGGVASKWGFWGPAVLKRPTG